jgi:hypothetical protein
MENLPMSAKAVTDELAAQMGVDDADRRLEFRFTQAVHREETTVGGRYDRRPGFRVFATIRVEPATERALGAVRVRCDEGRAVRCTGPTHDVECPTMRRSWR